MNDLVSIIGVVLRIVLVVAILGFFGFETTSFAALLAGAGIAIGAAWSGMLGNFAVGMFLQLFSPISGGDYIEGGDVEGTVKEVGMFVTSITTPENVVNIIANAKLLGASIRIIQPLPITLFSFPPPNSITVLMWLRQSPRLRKRLKKVPKQTSGMKADIEVLEISERGPCLVVCTYIHQQLLVCLFRHASND